MSAAPPPVIDFSRVIAYAIVDSSVEWTGKQCLYVGDELLGPVSIRPRSSENQPTARERSAAWSAVGFVRPEPIESTSA